MKTYVALLYSIILGAGRRVVMADLRKLSEDAGFINARTLAATGNLVLDCHEDLPAADVEQMLERAIEERLGKHIDVIARSGDDWLRLVAANPFPDESQKDASLVIVRVMRVPLTEQAIERLQPWCLAGEQIKIVNGDLWIAFPGQPSKSRLLSRLTLRHLGAGTMRNWNTISGLARLIEC